ncbi:unnamed protein product, partial [Symbiodinium microadriaticum]
MMSTSYVERMSDNTDPPRGEGTSFSSIDSLITECNNFLSQISQIRDSLEAGSGSKGIMQAAHKLRQWRSRRRDERLHSVMHSLLPRIKSNEEYLRDFIIQIVEKKLALRDQARHLKCRLEACINYNGDYIDGQEDLIEEMRNAVNSLSTESSVVKVMVSFNVELVRQRVMETVRHNRSFVSWGSKAVLLRPISEQELAEDSDHPALMERLNRLRESREQLVMQLSQLLETREAHIVNLDAATLLHKNLLDLLQNDGISSSDSQVFDHAHCHDCSYVQSISRDCVVHLQSLTKQTVDASQRLLQLVELREKVRDSAEFLSVDDLSDGSTHSAAPSPVTPNKGEGVRTTPVDTND